MSWFSKVKDFFRGESEGFEAKATSPQVSVPTADPCQATAPRRPALAPVLQNAGFSQVGGVQGLEWYKARLKQDADGDIADEFLEESAMRLHQPDARYHTALQASQPHAAARLTDGSVVVSQGNVHVILPRR